MRKLTSIVLLAIFVLLVGVTANAETLDTTIDSVTTALDKNGNEYVRFIVTVSREEGGIKYDMGIPVLAFGDLVAQAKTFKAGDKLECAASYRKLPDGRESYTIRGFKK
jgi:hypothetical protein